MHWFIFGGIRFRDMSGSAKGERSRVSGLYTHGGGFAGFIKQDDVKMLFKGVQALRQQAQQVKENSPVCLEPRPAEKKKLRSQDMIEKRRGSVLTVNKYHRAMRHPEGVKGWATAVVLSEDGICVSNYHVFWEFFGPDGQVKSTR